MYEFSDVYEKGAVKQYETCSCFIEKVRGRKMIPQHGFLHRRLIFLYVRGSLTKTHVKYTVQCSVCMVIYYILHNYYYTTLNWKELLISLNQLCYSCSLVSSLLSTPLCLCHSIVSVDQVQARMFHFSLSKVTSCCWWMACRILVNEQHKALAFCIFALHKLCLTCV